MNFLSLVWRKRWQRVKTNLQNKPFRIARETSQALHQTPRHVNETHFHACKYGIHFQSRVSQSTPRPLKISTQLGFFILSRWSRRFAFDFSRKLLVNINLSGGGWISAAHRSFADKVVLNCDEVRELGIRRLCT